MPLRNGWSLSEVGVCKGPGCTEISLRYCGRKSITRAVLTSWDTDLHHRVNHRNGLSMLGAIDFRATQYAVAQIPNKYHVVAANCISGGHMSAAAQSQWDPLVDSKCRFCGGRDTKWHRCFECPLASTVRKAFDPMLHSCSALDSCLSGPRTPRYPCFSAAVQDGSCNHLTRDVIHVTANGFSTLTVVGSPPRCVEARHADGQWSWTLHSKFPPISF